MKQISLFVILLFSFNSFSQINFYSDDFESYQGFGDIPAEYAGGMRVYSNHGFMSQKSLCINFSQFKSVDSTMTPPSAVLSDDALFKFRYRYASYIAGNAFSGYELNSDILEIYASIAGSNDFGAPLLTIDNSTHETSLEFAPIEIDLSAFSGQSVQIKVKGIRGAVEDFWLDMDDFIIEGSEPNSLRPQSNEAFKFWPNPAKDIINIIALDFTSVVKIIGIDGKTLIQETLAPKNNLIDLSELKAGIYFIQLSNSNFLESSPLIIAH